MPMLDMPLDQLRLYQGVNPRPHDFDDYWRESLTELDSVDPAVQLAPADFRHPAIESFDLFFTGSGGARIYAKVLTPREQAQPGPAICLFHGYGGSSGGWFDKVPWAAAGFTVAAMDCRGQAGQSEDVVPTKGNTRDGHIIKGLSDEPTKLYYRHVFLDTVRLARVVMDMPGVDPARVAAHGMSQGGALTLACAALEPRIARCAPVYPFLCDYKRVWEMDQAERAYVGLREHLRKADPTHHAVEQVWRRLGYIDCQHLAPRIRGDVLFFTGLMDNICPPSTQFAAYNKIEASKDMVIYPDFAHEALPGAAERVWDFMADL